MHYARLLEVEVSLKAIFICVCRKIERRYLRIEDMLKTNKDLLKKTQENQTEFSMTE